MTALPVTPAPSELVASRKPGRIIGAARLHAANPWPTLILPWAIFAAVFGMTWVIQYLVMTNIVANNPDAQAGSYNGGGLWIVIYMMIMVIQAMNLTFRFALGISLTRREYYLGTMAFFGVVAVYYATGITFLAVIERATDGWGIGLLFFAPEPLASESWWVIWVVWIALFALFVSIGAAVATIYVRWGANGLIAFFVGLALAIAAILWALIGKPAGEAFVRWATEATILEGMLATVPVSLIWLAAGFANLRKASTRG